MDISVHTGIFRCIRKIAKLRRVTIRFIMSVCLSVRTSVRLFSTKNADPTAQIFTKFDFYVLIDILSRKLNFH